MYFKFIGMALGIVSSSIVFYWLLTGQLHQQLTGVGIIISCNVFFSLVLPKVFPKNNSINAIQEGIHLFAKKMNDFILAIVLSIVYLVGVGFVWIVAKALGKKFMILRPAKTTWVPSRSKNDFNELF